MELRGCMSKLKLDPTITRDHVKEYLAKQNAYTLHKPYRKRFTRNSIVVGAIDKQWQVDLADMTDLARVNDGFRYF